MNNIELHTALSPSADASKTRKHRKNKRSLKDRLRAGFTLLEVMIALSILSLGLMVLLDAQGGGIGMTEYARDLTIGTQLARAKMAKLEQEIEDKQLQFGLDKSVCKDGDFSEDGKDFARFKWRYCIKKVEVAVPTQLPGMGEAKDAEGQQKQGSSLLAAMGIPMTSTSTESVLGSMGPMLGMIKPMMTAQFKQLQEAMREVEVKVTWKQGSRTYDVQVVTHIFNFNPQTGFAQPYQPFNPSARQN